MSSAKRIIQAVAPVRICDIGGWTDTWFADYGCIFNIAVSPLVEVQIAVYAREDRQTQVWIHAENFGDRYAYDAAVSGWQKHPLLEAAIRQQGVPDDLAVGITVYSPMPAGAGTGTSAAVAVALIGALDRLSPGWLTPHEIASQAHATEVEMLGLQSGIQDQLCAAYGGVSFIEMNQYPASVVTPVPISAKMKWELERRLILIYLGKPHRSSKVHEMVIRELENSGPANPKIEALRRLAAEARQVVSNGDVAGLGRVMVANTEAQRNLHPRLVGTDAQQVIALAQAHNARGWKVNGAGGEGGSITVLCGPDAGENRAFLEAITNVNGHHFQVIPIRLIWEGLRVWETEIH